MSDDLTVLGVDGISRSFDEHYDTMMEVVEDPTGAYFAIQSQHNRIEELEAKLKAKEKLMLALAGDKIDLVSELAGVKGKLAKAVCFVGEVEAGPSWGESLPSWVNSRMLSARTTIAELSSNMKGQDDGC